MNVYQYIGIGFLSLVAFFFILAAWRSRGGYSHVEPPRPWPRIDSLAARPTDPAALEAQRLRNLRLELDWLPRFREQNPKLWTERREARLQELKQMKEKGEI